MNKSLNLKGSGGSGLYSNKDMAINLCIYNQNPDEYVLDMIAIAIHEILHMLISKHNTINRKMDKDYFEEAVLDYFVPHGILSHKLGIIKGDNI